MLRAAALCAGAAAAARGIAVPTPEQIEYQEMGVGALIHFNLQTLCTTAPGHSRTRCQKAGYLPTEAQIREWNPARLDTDQWVDAAVSFGARYAVLVVDHFSGFTMWPSRTGNYSIAMTAWRGGKGDVLGDFVASCRRRGVRPGVFYSVHMNWHEHVSNFVAKGDQAAFNAYANAQVEELLTAYGPLLGIWFDAGNRNDLNPGLGPLVRRLQPTALCHNCLGFTQDPKDPRKGYGLRWAGNENGAVPNPSWGAAHMCGQNRTPGAVKENFKGDPLGEQYCPAEGDTVLRQHYWFWYNDTERTAKSTKQLLAAYLSTVGHAGNLILDMSPDPTGAVPAADVAAYARLGAAIECLYTSPLGNTTTFRDCGANGTRAWCWGGGGPAPGSLGVVLREDISGGQLINKWALDIAGSGGEWAEVAAGASVGARRILPALRPPKGASLRLRLRVLSDFAAGGGAGPRLRSAAQYDWPSHCGQ